jgi:myo-inositol 2-dehydrogenase/D-chiro-inositol 1-dehydrogenase
MGALFVKHLTKKEIGDLCDEKDQRRADWGWKNWLHAENIAAIPYAQIKAVSDLYLEPIREWADRMGIPKVTSNVQDVLKDPEIDAVFICTSTAHSQLIAEAAEAGKHIFCEKPINAA